jgi:DNA-binding NarL/FixJ family response regulator
MLVSMEGRLGTYIADLETDTHPAPATSRPDPGTTGRVGSDTISVVVADGSDRFRSGIVDALDARPGIRVVGEAADGPTALALVRRLHPQVVLVDLRLVRPGAVGLIREIARSPRLIGVRIAVLAGHGDELLTLEARSAGANASIDRAMSRGEICDVVEALATG